MFDAKNPQGRAHPKRHSQLQTYTEMKALAKRRARHKMGIEKDGAN